MTIGTKLKHDIFLGIEKGTYDHHVTNFMEANNLVVIPPEKLCEYLRDVTEISAIANGPCMWTKKPHSDDMSHLLLNMMAPYGIDSIRVYHKPNMPCEILKDEAIIPEKLNYVSTFTINIQGVLYHSINKTYREWLDKILNFDSDENTPSNELLSNFKITVRPGETDKTVLMAVGAYPIEITSDYNKNTVVVFNCVLAMDKDQLV